MIILDSGGSTSPCRTKNKHHSHVERYELSEQLNLAKNLTRPNHRTSLSLPIVRVSPWRCEVLGIRITPGNQRECRYFGI